MKKHYIKCYIKKELTATLSFFSTETLKKFLKLINKKRGNYKQLEEWVDKNI